MKIGIDIRGTQGQNATRGIGKYIFNLIEGVTKMGANHQFKLIAFPDLPIPERLKELSANCQILPLATPRVVQHWNHRVPRAWLLHQIIRQRQHNKALVNLVRREKLDVLHLTDVTNFDFYSEGEFNGCRVVKTLYDLIPLVLKDDFWNKWSREQRYLYKRKVNSFSDASVTVSISESARDDAIRILGISPEVVKTVLCCVSEEFQFVEDELRLKECLKRYRISSNYFLFCSGAGPNKNAERVVEAAAYCIQQSSEPLSLVFVGPQHKSAVEALKSSCFDSGLSREQVRVIGFVPDEDLITLFNGAIALVTPSLYEGFGLPAAQAMCTGTPVIASNRSSHPEVVGDAGLLVDPYSVEAISEAMLRLAQDDALRFDLSSRGLKRAKMFDWQLQAQAMLQIYQSAD